MSKNTNLKPLALFVTNDTKIDRRVLQEASTLEDNGWSVKILAMPLEKSKDSQELNGMVARISVEKQKIYSKVSLLFKAYRKVRKYLPMNGRVMRFLKRLTVSFFVDPEKLYLSLYHDWLNIYNPNIVFAIDLPMLPVASKIAENSQAKLIYDSHELYTEQELSKFEKKTWRKIELKYIYQCDSVIAVNKSISKELEKRYNLPHVNVIYNAINSEKNVERKEKKFHLKFNLSPTIKTILFQGGLSKGRNIEAVIEAMRFVKQEDVVLVILGDGQLKKQLSNMVMLRNLKHKVYFHDAVAQEELLTYTMSADFGIIPYQATCLNNYYCTPNKLFEFIAAGLPIIGSDLPEITRIVKGANIGLTADMSNANSIANLITKAIEDKENYNIWTANLIKAQHTFNWQKEGEVLLSIIKELH